MKAEQLRGYILEEALAYLIRSSGYELIVNPGEDTHLRIKGSGLQIRGRGGWHQADVLGTLEIVPAFSYPTRLFVEAKYHKTNPVGIGIVRNAIGTIIDLNTQGVVSDGQNPISYNYQYQYTLFSATGFNREAIDLALSHGISLVELNTADYRSLLDVIYSTANTLTTHFNNKNLLSVVRSILRMRLGTAESRIGLQNYHDLDTENIEMELHELIDTIHSYRKLYIGTVNAPFMILLKADDPEAFEEFALDHERVDHLVEIHWDTSIENGGKWTINPEEDPNAYSLSFKVPKMLYSWIFAKEAQQIIRSRDAKMRYFAKIYVYLRNSGVDKVIKLKLSDTFIQSLR